MDLIKKLEERTQERDAARAEVKELEAKLEAARKELEGWKQKNLAWICSECSGFANSSDVSLDTGTTLTCDTCKGKTVVQLWTTKAYQSSHEKQGERDRQNSIFRAYLEDIASATEEQILAWGSMGMKILVENAKRALRQADPTRKCGKCGKGAFFYCPGSSAQIPERLFHPAHMSCVECDKGIGCAMIGQRVLNDPLTCVHRWVDASNKVVSQCEMCPDCFLVRATEPKLCGEKIFADGKGGPCPRPLPCPHHPRSADLPSVPSGKPHVWEKCPKCGVHKINAIKCACGAGESPLEAALSRIETLEFHLKDKEADAKALQELSAGLYKRIPDKHASVVPSNCQTALNYIDALSLQVNELTREGGKVREELERSNKKWWEYERDYILPSFTWAKEIGLDLEAAVSANAGKNCVELLVSALLKKVKETEHQLSEATRKGEDLCYAYGGALLLMTRAREALLTHPFSPPALCADLEKAITPKPAEKCPRCGHLPHTVFCGTRWDGEASICQCEGMVPKRRESTAHDKVGYSTGMGPCVCPECRALGYA